MALSKKDSTKAATIILKHLKPEKAKALLRDLSEINGNKSFEDTIARITSEIWVQEGEPL